MPIPKRKQNEDKNVFVSRCMGNETMKKDYPDEKQRVAICLGQTRQKSKSSLLDSVLEILFYSFGSGCSECDGYEEELTLDNLIVPDSNDYIDYNEETEEYDLSSLGSYRYKNPKTGEIFYYDMRNNYKKDGVQLVYVGKGSELQAVPKNLAYMLRMKRAML